MNFIKIYGDDDYAALTFEQKNISLQEALQKCEESENGVWEFEEGCFAEAFEFPIGNEFFLGVEELVFFIKNEICDYDMLKHTEFFVVKPKEQ